MSACISRSGEFGEHSLDESHTCTLCGVLDEEALRAELKQAKNLLADLVIKATEYGTQDGDFVANYLLPTGPIHRAIPWLEERGIVVRPGFDGRKPAAEPSGEADLDPNAPPIDQAGTKPAAEGQKPACSGNCDVDNDIQDPWCPVHGNKRITVPTNFIDQDRD